ncbi:MAG: hypothetical protein V2I38_02005 [Alcanivoracaceae bacterium]|jgi:hypothetical protein|nr:hypothetical protein [Alcanivoracaceae bacterium]
MRNCGSRIKKNWIGLPITLGGLLLVTDALGMAKVPPPRPEPPLIMRDMAKINDQFRFTSPIIPGNRTTMDGRVALVAEGGAGREESPILRNLIFSLHVPERVNSPIMTGPAGAEILGEGQPVMVPVPSAIPAGLPLINYNYHHTICDASPEFFTPAEKPNPYTCGADGRNDCYDVTIITSTSLLLETSLWGTPARIEVANPKTRDARIVDVSLGETIRGARLHNSPNLNEPVVTEDGRLLTGRRGGFPRLWTNPNTGHTGIYGHDLVYSVLPDHAQPCDVTGWRDFHPISHAPYDSNMIGRYGLASYPFRDTEGKFIADGDDMGGTYPWVDRKGDNVFMSGIGARLSEEKKDRFPRRCAQGGASCDSYEQPKDYDRGQMVGGAWTHGKFVLLDAQINHVDWAVGVAPQAHFNVDLYRNAAGADVSARVGGGRFVMPLRKDMVPHYPAGYSFNPNILDSVQNIFNYHDNLKTITPQDVVWLMSNGVATDEIAFDDYLYFDALIISNMQASISQGPLNINSGRTPQYRDGNKRNLYQGIVPVFNIYEGGSEEIRIQNAATSLEWKTPAYGRVEQGNSRIEPVAMGGIKGKGFWLDGSNRIHYSVPDQSGKSISHYPWYISLFVDPRLAGNEGKPVTLMTFPDGTAIRVLVSNRSVRRAQYVRGTAVIADIAVSAKSGWRHLAWQLEPGNRTVTMLVDGFAHSRHSFSQPLFQMQRGALVVGGTGSPSSSFRGWLDEFKVLAQKPNPEVSCNHARGTMIAIDYQEQWFNTAGRYPGWAHQEVAQVAAGEAAASGRYACFHDYSRDWGAHLANIPSGTRGLREVINFPEGPLRYGQPRPDSTANAFCLSCHHDAGKDGLTIDALAYRPINVEDDRRRQPSQPPQRVFGNLPANWIAPGEGQGSPGQPDVAPARGAKIDQWVLPH